jgi:hypothetical protein
MFLVLFVDGVEVARAIEEGEGIECTQDTAHIEGVVAGKPSPDIPYAMYVLTSYGQRKGPWLLNCI